MGDESVKMLAPITFVLVGLMAVAQAADGTGGPLWRIPVDQLSALRDRPLFSPDRRPVAAPAPALAAPADVPDDLGDTRLIGIVRSDTEGDLAIVVREGSPAKRLRQGDSLGGWRLVQVGAREIVLEADDRAQRVLRLKPSVPLMAPRSASAPLEPAPAPR